MEQRGQGPTAMVRRFLLTEDPHPGVIQGVFVALYLLDVILRALGGSGVDAWPAIGLVLVIIITVLAAIAPWSTLPLWAVAVVPVLDLAALGLSRLDAAGGGAGLLVVIPALWLGAQVRDPWRRPVLGRRGVGRCRA